MFSADSFIKADAERMKKMLVLLCLHWWSLTGVFAAETSETHSVLVMEGDSVTLYNDAEIQKTNNILWKYGAENHVIGEISRKYGLLKTYDDVPDGRFRDRLKLDDQTGSLTIMNIRTEHAGVYQISGMDLTSKTFSVSVYARLPVPVISRDSSQCSSSSNCSLVCSAVNVSHVTLSWYKGNSLLSSISVSDLSISLSLPLEVELQDNNTYSCVLNNSFTNQTQHLDITSLCHTCADSVSLIESFSVAAGSLLIMAGFGIFCIYLKHRKTEQHDQTHNDEIIYTEPTFNRRNAHKSKAGEEEDHVDYVPITKRR